MFSGYGLRRGGIPDAHHRLQHDGVHADAAGAGAGPQARRRCLELEQKGTPADYEQTLREIRQRDEQDMNRETAPLKPAADSVLLDTSDLDFDGAVQRLLEIVRERS